LARLSRRFALQQLAHGYQTCNEPTRHGSIFDIRIDDSKDALPASERA
jgi:hypothetical protein